MIRFPLLLSTALLLALSLGAAAQDLANAPDIAGSLQAARRGDAASALRILTPLAEKGDATAQYALGTIYANGDGVAADYAQAARWFEAAAKGGNAEARQNLAFMRQMKMVSAGPAVAAVPDGAFRIRVATVGTEAEAAREWRRQQKLHPDALGNLQVVAVPLDTPNGDRRISVEGGTLDEDGAKTACTRLRADGASCFVIKPQ